MNDRHLSVKKGAHESFYPEKEKPALTCVEAGSRIRVVQTYGNRSTIIQAAQAGRFRQRQDARRDCTSARRFWQWQSREGDVDGRLAPIVVDAIDGACGGKVIDGLGIPGGGSSSSPW